MTTTIFDIFSIGIGPSSSHTIGPMRAAGEFTLRVVNSGRANEVGALKVDLFGSLALTGKGHCTDIAVLLGLSGETPEEIDPEKIPALLETIRTENRIELPGVGPVKFTEASDLVFHYEEQLPHHANGMRFSVFGNDGLPLLSEVFYSIGGGFIMDEKQIKNRSQEEKPAEGTEVPFPFSTARELVAHCNNENRSIAEVMLENEKAARSEEETRKGALAIWKVMEESIHRGCRNTGLLPGGLKVRRRAADIHASLMKKGWNEPSLEMDWINLFALAVSEENAAGGKVVTAPTNGAAGIIPAVLQYYLRYFPGSGEDQIVDFLLTAGAVGLLFKMGASISAAEVGCQGEVGVACSMAAAGLCAVMGGTVAQVENAAEIGMEHNLGLTCDPMGGLVQIPCIERNALGAVKAINAARLAILGDGQHIVPLDKVIATMHKTGKDMLSQYKETSLGGLAVSLPEC